MQARFSLMDSLRVDDMDPVVAGDVTEGGQRFGTGIHLCFRPGSRH